MLKGDVQLILLDPKTLEEVVIEPPNTQTRKASVGVQLGRLRSYRFGHSAPHLRPHVPKGC